MTLSSADKQLQIIKRQSECRWTSTECQLMERDDARGTTMSANSFADWWWICVTERTTSLAPYQRTYFTSVAINYGRDLLLRCRCATPRFPRGIFIGIFWSRTWRSVIIEARPLMRSARNRWDQQRPFGRPETLDAGVEWRVRQKMSIEFITVADGKRWMCVAPRTTTLSVAHLEHPPSANK